MRVAFILQEQPHISVEYLSASLKANIPGVEVRIFFDPLQYGPTYVDMPRLAVYHNVEDILVDDLMKWEPTVIGFSVMSHAVPWALRMCRKIKSAGITAPIVFGGVHPTSDPDRVLAKPEVDYACVGEAEQFIVDFTLSADAGEVDLSLPGLAYRRNGKNHKNPMAPLVQDLDSLPRMDKDVFFDASPIHAWSGTYQTLASRGCPYYCSYCSRSITNDIIKDSGPLLRMRGVDDLIDELEEALKKYNYKRILFFDEIFTINRRWFTEFAEKYKQRINKPYWGFTHPTCVDEEAIEMLADSNCFSLTLGVQSVFPKVREALGRRHTNEHLVKILTKLRETKIQVFTDNILWLPGQTIDDALAHADFYHENKVELACTYQLQFWAATRITEEMHEKGVVSDDEYEEIAEGRWVGTMASTRDTSDMGKAAVFVLIASWLPGWLFRFMRKNNRWKKMIFINNRNTIRFLYTEYQRFICGVPPNRSNLHPFIFLLQGVFVLFRKIKYRLRGGKHYPDTYIPPQEEPAPQAEAQPAHTADGAA